MSLATYKDLCIDAVDPALLGRFWAGVLGLDFEARAHVLRGRGDEIDWDVLADPEGNEFCAFAPMPEG